MSQPNDAPTVLSQVASTPASPREVVFVDSTLPNWQDLLTHISPDAKVVVLDPLKNGIVQMAEALQNETGVQAVHLLSHGGSGFVVVGNTMLSSYNLDSYTPQLAVIRAALADQADFLLYGCDVAQGEAGASFVQQLALATGADVAASSDDTGTSGDWVLEVQSGAVEAPAIQASNYGYDLATIVVTTLNDTGAGSLRAAIDSANNTVADTIVFDPALFASGAQTITLTTGELNVDGNANAADALTIIGPDENLLTISGNNSSRIFNANGTLQPALSTPFVTSSTSNSVLRCMPCQQGNLSPLMASLSSFPHTSNPSIHSSLYKASASIPNGFFEHTERLCRLCCTNRMMPFIQISKSANGK